MKKKNLKSLKLNKKSISNLHLADTKGGRSEFVTSYFSCFTGICISINNFGCPTGSICPTAIACPSEFYCVE